MNQVLPLKLFLAGFTALLSSFTIKAREELLMGEKVKDVLVTGATGGIGSSIVECFVKQEAKVLATGTNEEKLIKLKIWV